MDLNGTARWKVDQMLMSPYHAVSWLPPVRPESATALTRRPGWPGSFHDEVPPEWTTEQPTRQDYRQIQHIFPGSWIAHGRR